MRERERERERGERERERTRERASNIFDQERTFNCSYDKSSSMACITMVRSIAKFSKISLRNLRRKRFSRNPRRQIRHGRKQKNTDKNGERKQPRATL